MMPMDLVNSELDWLTPIQREIFALLAQGFPTSNLIGRRMNMNPRRVDKHIAAVFRRLGVSDRRSALAKLIELERKALENHPPGERFPLFDLDHSGLSLDVLKSGRRSHAVEEEFEAGGERPAVPSEQRRVHAVADLVSSQRGPLDFGEWIGASRSDSGVGGVDGAERPMASPGDDLGPDPSRSGRHRGGAEGLLHSGWSLVAGLGALGRVALIIIGSSAVAILFTISVFATRLMLSLLQGTPVN